MSCCQRYFWNAISGIFWNFTDKAIPCGLILNEIITNALKHAFITESAGDLWIVIAKTDNDEIRVLIRDNGLGCAKDVDVRHSKGIGLYLVNGLVINQLYGQWEVSRDHRTAVRITFPA
jgi:two-component sensor histidine kinase